jgi:hypothetical protein
MDNATPEPRCCEVCGGRIDRDNRLGICGRTPECRTARNLKKRRSLPRPEQKSCEVCGGPIRSDNELGICQRPDRPKCRNARARKQREQGTLGKARYCEVCGCQLRRDNAMGVCSGRGSDACAQERDRRRRSGGGTPARPEGWTRPPYMKAGAVFARLTVLEDALRSQDSVLVRCECNGAEKRIGRAVDLTMGTTRSCGCLRRDLLTSHGLSKHPLYRTWSGIVSRTTNPNDDAYPNYGGRGIRMSERWLNDLQAFIEDIESEIGPRPEGVTAGGSPQYTIDRINVEGNYESGNIQWGTWAEQGMNKRKVPVLTRQRDALAAQVQALTAQLQAIAEQPPAPARKRGTSVAASDTLF